MDVTRSNFKEQYENLVSSISDATFLSLDGEFTGISQGKGIHSFDTPEERYLKLKEGASNFMLIQFGLCTFHYCKKSQTYKHRGFNFYLFPRPFKRNAPDSRFLCQVSSMDFLATQGFDFNKVFKEGLSYLRPANEERIRTEIINRHESYKLQRSPGSSSKDISASRTPIAIPPEQQEYINNVCVKVDLLLESKKDNSLELPPANRFVRKLIYQTLQSKFGKKVYCENKSPEKDSRLSSIIVTKVCDDGKLKEMEDARLREELDELDDAVGFSKIIKKISESKKLVIGHNMLLDLLLSINQFSCPLPEDYEDFKILAKCLFPNLLDTKVMASLPSFKDKIYGTALGDLQKHLSQHPFCQPIIDPSEGYEGYSLKSSKFHEAGYDAFITGICFISMCNYLGGLQSPQLNTVLPGTVLLEPYMNKVFLLKVYDVPYMNLNGPEIEANRDHVFHLKFPKEWKTSDICQLFNPYGAVYVAWVDDISAFVSLKQSLENPANVIKTLGNSSVYSLTTYKEHTNGQKSSKKTENKLPIADVGLNTFIRKRKLSSEGLTVKKTRKIDTILEEDEQEANTPVKSIPLVQIIGDSVPDKKKVFDENESWEV